MKLNSKVFLVLFVVSICTFINQAKAQTFDKAAYYKVMEAGKLDAVDQQIKIIQAAKNINNDAYVGAMLMKRAGLVKGPSRKLNAFRDGHGKLESAIQKDNSNPEWRFLRLIIQENAPGILNYSSDIDKDAKIIQGSFAKLSPEVQSAVRGYKKQSDTLQKLNF